MRRQYHHGDLRRVLLDAAFSLADERGVEALTLREVARQAGVSHAAPYHHFADKAALLDALTVQSYDALTVVVRAASDSALGNALDRLSAIGVAYVRFALEQPTAFQFLYRPGAEKRDFANKDGKGHADAIEAAMYAAYEVLHDVITAGQQAGVVVSGDPEALVLTVWATAHGLAILLRDGAYGQHPQGTAEENKLANVVFTTLIVGLSTPTRTDTRIEDGEAGAGITGARSVRD